MVLLTDKTVLSVDGEALSVNKVVPTVGEMVSSVNGTVPSVDKEASSVNGTVPIVNGEIMLSDKASHSGNKSILLTVPFAKTGGSVAPRAIISSSQVVTARENARGSARSTLGRFAAVLRALLTSTILARCSIFLLEE